MTCQAGEMPGTVFHWLRAYDLLLRLVWGRRESRYRAHVLELAGITSSQAVLDVGCGTGTLAIGAKTLVGPDGRVSGIDASREMIACAKGKALKLGLAIDFKEATAQELPFPEASFDAVLNTTMIHCLPEAQRTRCFEEMARVLKPGGRLLVVELGGPAQSKHSLFGHMHMHRRFDLTEEIARLDRVGLAEIGGGPTGFPDLHYILATRSNERASMRGAALF
jgi:ubiquinone/menaquinone biosynthesis C-methylase UbiE